MLAPMFYNNPALTFLCLSPLFTLLSCVLLTVFIDSIGLISLGRLKVVLTASSKNNLISILFS
jgi:hypothetical protein